MIRLLLKLAEFVWRPSPVNEPEDKDKLTSSTKTKAGHVNLVTEKTQLYGRITSVHEGYGLIDRHIYFDLDVVFGPKLPEEHDRVIVTVTKTISRSSDGTLGAENGLVAESVQIVTEFWDADDDSTGDVDRRDDTTEVVRAICGRPCIGQVTKVEPDRFTVNEDICLAFKDVTLLSKFTPRVGDWLSLKQFGEEKVVDVSPLRTKAFKGKITALEMDLAIVENEVYFYVSDCTNGYLASVDDIVNGIAAENSAYEPDYQWRYINFAPVFTVESQRLQQRTKLKIRDLTTLILNKQGIVVASPLDFGVILVGKRCFISAFIKNEGTENQTLIGCTFADDSARQFSVTNAELDIPSDAAKTTQDSGSERLVIPPEGVACVNIICDARFIGKTKELIVFEFDGFSIGRQVFAHIKDPKQDLLHQNGTPYVKKGSIRENDDSLVNNGNIRENVDNSLMEQYFNQSSDAANKLPARYIKKKQKVHLPVFLPKYDVPLELLRCAEDRNVLLNRIPCLMEELSMHNYKRKFSTLLHLEEIEQSKQMMQFNMKSVLFRTSGDYLVLTVDGLAEGRPSLLIGDCVIASDPYYKSEMNQTFEGCIHQVHGLEIYLQFHEQFHNRCADKAHDVSFSFGRTPLRRCHQAISLWQRIGKDVLFPEQKDAASEQSISAEQHFKRDLISNKCLNERQLQAVKYVVEGHCRPAPYIIYGPPGTGKTVTLVEAVLQVFLQRAASRILVCVPSNSAADLVCERLHGSGNFTTSDLVRLNAHHRKEESLSKIVRNYSNFSVNYYVVLHYRVIVTTCVTSGVLYSLGIPQGHFTHVFIDEAGQCTEPEALISMCLTAATSTDVPSHVTTVLKDSNRETEAFQVVLVGDPMQLGPVIMSRLASEYGLQTSLLERLSRRRLYRRDEKWPEGYDPCYVTKLVDNYRSHTALLQLPSQLFYDGELVAKADKSITSALCNWIHLSNPDFPIIFHGIKGEDVREMDSPSWFNAEEVFRVVCYLQSLYCDMNLTADDIGIVTPYRKQVEKIRLLIDTVGVDAPKVGSVEEFQGQERMAIIVSTVRSSESWIQFDESHNLGFVFNEKRFNVTVTRAKSLLIVVGNPFVLIKDSYWRSFLRYCCTNNAYIGCEVNEIKDMLFGGQQ